MQGFETGELSPRAGDEIRTLGMDMKEAASDAQDKVTSSVREQAAKIGEKAKTVASDAGRKIEGALNDQRATGADYLQNMAGLVHQTADVFEREVPQASRYIRQAADQIDTVAEAVRTKDLREAVSDVQDFARRQPAIFFGGALLLGFAAVRMFKTNGPGASRNGREAN